MHYYKFNIGDYKSHTDHLELLEDLAYRRMLDWCYLHESPLPDDVPDIAKKICMRSHCDCIEFILKEFFTLKNTGWHQDRIKKEISVYHSKSDKAKASAMARWDKKAIKNKDIKDDANAMRTQCDRNANAMLNTKQETLNTKQETLSFSSSDDDSYVKPNIKKIPYQKIIDLYHSLCPDMPCVIELTDIRKKQIKARWNSNEDYQCREFWEVFFTAVAKSDLLNGRVNSFRADLQWLTKHGNFIKVLEGKYV